MLAEGIASGRLGPGPKCIAHGHAGASLPTGSRFRFIALPSRLLHCGFLSRDVFKALGFTTVIPRETPALANPVGLDGIFQAYCPPYFPSMDAAVDAILPPLLRQSAGPATPAQPRYVPYLMSDEGHRSSAVAISDEGIACTKAVCNYIYETYG